MSSCEALSLILKYCFTCQVNNSVIGRASLKPLHSWYLHLNAGQARPGLAQTNWYRTVVITTLTHLLSCVVQSCDVSEM